MGAGATWCYLALSCRSSACLLTISDCCLAGKCLLATRLIDFCDTEAGIWKSNQGITSVNVLE